LTPMSLCRSRGFRPHGITYLRQEIFLLQSVYIDGLDQFRKTRNNFESFWDVEHFAHHAFQHPAWNVFQEEGYSSHLSFVVLSVWSSLTDSFHFLIFIGVLCAILRTLFNAGCLKRPLKAMRDVVCPKRK